MLLLLAALILFASTSAALLFFHAPEPFVWIFAIATVLSLVAAVRTPVAWARGPYLISFGVSLALMLSEIALGVYERLHTDNAEASYTAGDKPYFVPDPSLGYAPTPGLRATAKLIVRDTVIYDVAYTIGSNGVRETKGNPQGESWLFAGCGRSWGRRRKAPSRVRRQPSRRRPQMLRILETDRARPLVHTPVRQVIYLALSDHPQRAAGRVSWDRFGPSYELSPTGLTFVGPFHGRIVGKLLGAAMRSHVLSFALERTVFRARMSDDDIERYGRIVERSAQLAREKFGAGFTVLYWDDDSDVSRRVLARLRATKLPIVLVSEIIPRAEWPRVVLPHDGHPTAEAYRRLSAALVQRLDTTSVR